MLKTIGIESRRELEQIIEGRVHLSLFVKVREHWQNDRERYTPWGLDPNA
jgi:GTP-binding protein Era